MDKYITGEEIMANSFRQLIQKNKQKYSKAETYEEKENIVNRFICDPEVSHDFLTWLLEKTKNADKEEKNKYLDTFEEYFSILIYSLSKESVQYFYDSLKKIKLENKEINTNSFQYLSINDPIDNFMKIYDKFSLFIDEVENEEKTKTNIKNIELYIEHMSEIYSVNLGKYYFPPLPQYPTYTYNFYSYSIFKTLKKFMHKRKQLFNNFINENLHYSFDEKRNIYYDIGKFFKDTSQVFNKLKYNNIYNNLKSLKIISFYFQCFEISRDYYSYSFRDIFLKIINSITSEPISSDILKRFNFYKENGKTPLKVDDWDSININEYLYVKYPKQFSVKIKHFKNDILSLNNELLRDALNSYSIDNLNIYGIINNSIIKYNKEIEDYSKKLLKKIMSSKNYVFNFLKYDLRFGSQNEKEKIILESMFNGVNSKEIFEEIWENIFFVPISDHDLCGFNDRNQYSIFINQINEKDPHITFQKIIPKFHSQINTLYHEFTHNIALLLAANLELDDFESNIINNYELNELQKKYYYIYNQNNIIYDEFDDFGNLMEVAMYGIRPRKYSTFSGLFCLNYKSYELDSNDFREVCAGLYNYDNKKSSQEKNLILGKYDLKSILDDLMDSEISKLLLKYFVLDKNNTNEYFTENGKPRRNINFLYNEEYTVNIDYCDKLN